jgi:hypothetical protein
VLEVSIQLILRPDTEDHDEARQEARDFVACLIAGWYSRVRLDGDPIVIVRPDEE